MGVHAKLTLPPSSSVWWRRSTAGGLVLSNAAHLPCLAALGAAGLQLVSGAAVSVSHHLNALGLSAMGVSLAATFAHLTLWSRQRWRNKPVSLEEMRAVIDRQRFAHARGLKTHIPLPKYRPLLDHPHMTRRWMPALAVGMAAFNAAGYFGGWFHHHAPLQTSNAAGGLWFQPETTLLIEGLNAPQLLRENSCGNWVYAVTDAERMGDSLRLHRVPLSQLSDIESAYLQSLRQHLQEVRAGRAQSRMMIFTSRGRLLGEEPATLDGKWQPVPRSRAIAAIEQQLARYGVSAVAPPALNSVKQSQRQRL